VDPDVLARLGGDQLRATGMNGMEGGFGYGQSPLAQAAARRVQGDEIANDPAVAAALENYRQNVQPGLQSQAALMGLGRSSSALGMQARAQASIMEPLMQAAMQREENRIGRQLGATQEEMGMNERASVRQSEAQQNMIGQLLNLAQMGQGRQANQIQALMQGGGLVRDVQNEQYQNIFNDYMRRQGLAEQAVGMPFGGLAGAGLGSTSRSSK
jgi:hypothetical protein